MRAATISLFLVLAMGTGSWSQEEQGRFAKEAPRPSGQDTRPVTVGEAGEVMRKLEIAIRRSLLRSNVSVAKAKPGAAPVKSPAIVKELGRLFDLCRPKFKATPPMQTVNRSVLRLAASDPARPTLEKLIRWGCVGPVGPLATSRSMTLTPVEFGDAVGFFISRMAELTHTPSSEWSPYMNWHLEGPGGNRIGKGGE